MRSIKSLIQLVCMICVFSSGIAQAQSYSSIDEMLKDQKIIRVLIDHAPGFGNQAASVNMMNRLRQLHFQGTYEVIYPEAAESKIISLFNLPKILPPIYHFENTANEKIDFIRESEYVKQLKNKLIAPVLLSISGAHDSDSETSNEDPATLTTYKNLSKFTVSSVYVQIQPWFRQAKVGDYVATPNNKKIEINPRGKYWVYPFSSFTDAKKYLTDNPDGKIFAAKEKGIQALMESIEQQQVNILPVYGYPFLKSANYSQGNEFDYPQNIFQVLAGARYAQLNGGVGFDKPLIIAVFYDYQNEAQELTELFNKDNWGEYESLGGNEVRAALNELGLKKPNVFSTISLAEDNAFQVIKSLRPGQILLLSMGSLPKVVFDGLYTYTGNNSWPAIREGESSLSMLIQTGKPHFRCVSYYNEDIYDSRWEMGFDLINNAELKNTLMDLYGKNGLCAIDGWKRDPLIYKKLGTLIIQSKDENSTLSRYFADIKIDTQDRQKDRIYRGLEKALTIVTNGNQH